MNINVWIVVMIAFVKDVLAETSKFTDVIILLIYNLFSLIFLFPWYTWKKYITTFFYNYVADSLSEIYGNLFNFNPNSIYDDVYSKYQSAYSYTVGLAFGLVILIIGIITIYHHCGFCGVCLLPSLPIVQVEAQEWPKAGGSFPISRGILSCSWESESDRNGWKCNWTQRANEWHTRRHTRHRYKYNRRVSITSFDFKPCITT